MKDKITTIIMSVIIIFIFIIIVFMGILFLDEYEKIQISSQPEDIQTVMDDERKIEKENSIEETNIINPIESVNNEKKEEQKYKEKNFYNQLENYSKIIYQALDDNRENMKSGNYKIEFKDTFSDLLNKEDGQTLLNKYYQSAVESYIYDNPEIFYLDVNKMYLNIRTTTRKIGKTFDVYINSGEQNNYFTDVFSSEQEVSEAISKLESVKNDILQNRTGNIYNDIKMVHDYIVDNTDYDTTTSKANIYNIYGTLINKQAVCEGYARTFKYIMDELNIPCTIVIGEGTDSEGKTEKHAWNYVKVDENWYAIDTTWDDPISSTGFVTKSSKYRYFLKGSKEFFKDHISEGQISENGQVYTYPTISEKNYER